MKRTRRKPLSPEEREQAAVFKTGTLQDASCVMCGRESTFHPYRQMEAHHVVEKQELRRRKLPLYDPRNGLCLCRNCHERHTNALKRVPFRKLRAANIDYAYEVLGPFAADYIRASTATIVRSKVSRFMVSLPRSSR